MSGISKNDKNEYICHECGHTWRGDGRWLLWPPKLKWSSYFTFGRHGVETEPDGCEKRVFKTVLSIGWLHIVLGDGYKSKVRWSPRFQDWERNTPYLKIEENIDKVIETIIKQK